MDFTRYDNPIPIWKTIVVASIPAGVQFGGAILSLVVPYVQHLGVPHEWAPLIWLCGPISGMITQPIVGYASDRSTSRFGRRKPFIVAGITLICMGVLMISYALEAGVALGDSMEKHTKPKAIAIFVLGFWFLDVANNMVLDPTRAFLADLSTNNHQRIRMANAICSFFMAGGSILGYAASSNTNMYEVFPFTRNEVCDVFCANLKTCFLIDVVFLLILSIFALIVVSEPEYNASPSYANNQQSFFVQFKSAFSNLSKPMWLLYLVTAINWTAWFPFLLFNTDWVGKEVYGGNVEGTTQEKGLYDAGVQEGSFGLMLAAIAFGVMSLCVDPLSKVLGGARKLWGITNMLLAVVLASTVLVSKMAEHSRLFMAPGSPPSKDVKAATLTLFVVIGIPQAVTLSVPFALTSIFSSDSGTEAGHGLSLGVLNLAIVIPQLFVSLTSGQWDSLFGGGNLPSFIFGAAAAALSGVLALTILPSPSSNT